MRIEVVVALIRRDEQILITQRPDNVDLGRLWEFPGGKVEHGESFEDALEREIHEELGIKLRVNDEFFTTDYDYPAKSVRLHFFNCTIVQGEAQLLGVADIRWVNPKDLCNYQFPPADAELIVRLQSTS